MLHTELLPLAKNLLLDVQMCRLSADPILKSWQNTTSKYLPRAICLAILCMVYTIYAITGREYATLSNVKKVTGVVFKSEKQNFNHFH